MKNNYAARIRAKQMQEELICRERMKLFGQWCQQGSLDSMLILLGYGEVMNGKTFGPERIARAAQEWADIAKKVMMGISGAPDADAYRARTDKLLAKKVPEGFFQPWEQRYPEWKEDSLEDEVERDRSLWVKAGMIPRERGAHDYAEGKK